MTTVIVEKINNNRVDVIGKTFNSSCYSGDVGSREKIKGQTIITTNDIPDGMTIRGEGKDTPIRKVTESAKKEVFVQLLNAESLPEGKSLASAILKDVWVAPGIENSNMDEIFVMEGTNEDALREIIHIARSMSNTPTGARAMGKWYPSVDGKRVIIRIISKIDKNGHIVHEDEVCEDKTSEEC